MIVGSQLRHWDIFTFIKEEKDVKSHKLPGEKTIEDIWLTKLSKSIRAYIIFLLLKDE